MFDEIVMYWGYVYGIEYAFFSMYPVLFNVLDFPSISVFQNMYGHYVCTVCRVYILSFLKGVNLQKVHIKIPIP